MGLVVSFWSPWHGRGNTSNCVATAMQFSYKYNANILLTHTQYTRSNMETAFLTGKENSDLLSFTDIGIDSIERAIKTGGLIDKDFISYCHKIHNNLYLLTGSNKPNKELFNKTIGETIENICRVSKEVNDVTFVDLSSGINDDTTNKVLNISDVIVVTLDQSNTVCVDFFNNQIKHLDRDKVLVMIGKYDYESIYNKEYIDKTFKDDVLILPYLTDYLDAINNHRVNKLFNMYHMLEEEPFFNELNNIINQINDKAIELGYNFESKEPKVEKKKLFGFIRR